MGNADAGHAEWNPLIVCPHAEMSSRIRLALGGMGAGETRHFTEYPRMGAIAALAAQQGANVCFLDVATNPEHGMQLIGEAAPALPVVALHTRSDAEMILRCLRRGASEFLSDPTAEQVAVVLEHLRRARAPAAPRPQAVVYSVAPGKPGSGASTVAAQLAMAMKKQPGARVLLVDADTAAGTIAFLFKIRPEFHLGDVARDSTRLDEDLWARLKVAVHGADVLPAPENPSTRIELDRKTAHELMAFWRDHYDFVVIDTDGVKGSGLEMILLSDAILLVTAGDVASLYGSRRVVEFFEQNRVDRSKLRLVVNRYGAAGGLSRDEVRSAMKLEAYAVLAEDPGTLQEAVLSGKPAPAGSRWGRSVEALAARLAGKEKTEEPRKTLFDRLARKR